MKNLFKGDPFPSMVDLIPEGSSGDWRIEYFEITERGAFALKLRDAYNKHRNSQVYTPAGKYAKLVQLLPHRSAPLVHVVPVMSDTMMERKMMLEAYKHAHGAVLLVGLGLGMLAQAVACKSNVRLVHVLEKSIDVVALTLRHLHTRLMIQMGDAFSYKRYGMRYDMIYVDIWNGICQDNLPEIRKLKKRFKPYLRDTDKSWIGAWSEKELLAHASVHAV